jgi:hypothetical protein
MVVLGVPAGFNIGSIELTLFYLAIIIVVALACLWWTRPKTKEPVKNFYEMINSGSEK